MEVNSSSSSSSRQKTPHYASSLHSVRRAGLGASAKPWKKPVAPQPPTPPRVYKVDPVNFRDLVQKLTAAPEFSADSTRLHSLVPPPVDVATEALHRPAPSTAASLSTVYREFSEALQVDRKQLPHGLAGSSAAAAPPSGGFMGLNLPPATNTTSYSWCSYPMLSPGTLSSLERSTVL